MSVPMWDTAPHIGQRHRLVKEHFVQAPFTSVSDIGPWNNDVGIDVRHGFPSSVTDAV